jgi:hypothetical protein
MSVIRVRQLSYVLRFERLSKDAPTVARGLVSVTALDARSAPITTIWADAEGTASYTSNYTLDKDNIHFVEAGKITFGDAANNDTLAFSTIGKGMLLEDVDTDSGMTPGIVMWKIDSGTGFFAGAKGLIASNFRVHLDTDALQDDHLATIWLPDEETA